MQSKCLRGRKISVENEFPLNNPFLASSDSMKIFQLMDGKSLKSHNLIQKMLQYYENKRKIREKSCSE